MWTHTEFLEKYLRPRKLVDKWESLICPSMKEAIICSMLVAQDTIDPRKVDFLICHLSEFPSRYSSRILSNYSVQILCLVKISNHG